MEAEINKMASNSRLMRELDRRDAERAARKRKPPSLSGALVEPSRPPPMLDDAARCATCTTTATCRTNGCIEQRPYQYVAAPTKELLDLMAGMVA